ncbi:E3 ubiquitin-protein ligase RING1-like [Bienertia sinuspersici]
MSSSPLNVSLNLVSNHDHSSCVSRVAGLPTVSVENDVICLVCMEGFRRSAKQIPCGHVFHGDCIAPWLSITNSCPLCRNIVFRS